MELQMHGGAIGRGGGHTLCLLALLTLSPEEHLALCSLIVAFQSPLCFPVAFTIGVTHTGFLASPRT